MTFLLKLLDFNKRDDHSLNTGASPSFKSAVEDTQTSEVEEDQANMPIDPDESLFETSHTSENNGVASNEEEMPEERPVTPASTSRKSSDPPDPQEDDDDAWLANLTDAGKQVIEKSDGVVFIERLQSFLYGNWPYDVKRGNLCHPRALALAGLVFNSLEPTPSAKCHVCNTVLSNLQPNSNPWILHSESRPDCCLIQLGQRDEVDDYSLDEVFEMMFFKIFQDARQKAKERENIMKRQLFALKQLESGRKKLLASNKAANAAADQDPAR